MSSPYLPNRMLWGQQPRAAGGAAFSPQADQDLPFDPSQIPPSPDVSFQPEMEQRQNVQNSQQTLQQAMNNQKPETNFMDSPIFQLGIPAALTALTAIAPRHMATAGPLGMAGFRTAVDTNQLNEANHQKTVASQTQQAQKDFNLQRFNYAVQHSDIDPSIQQALVQQANAGDMEGAGKSYLAEMQKQQRQTAYGQAKSSLHVTTPGTRETLSDGAGGSFTAEGPPIESQQPKQLTIDQALMSGDPKIHAAAVQALRDKENNTYHAPTIQVDDTTGQLWQIVGGVGTPVKMQGGGQPAPPQISPAAQALIAKVRPPQVSPLSSTIDAAMPDEQAAPAAPVGAAAAPPQASGGPHFSKGASQALPPEKVESIVDRIYENKLDPNAAAKLGRTAQNQVTARFAEKYPEVDLADKQLEFDATKHAVASANSPTQMAVRQNINRASHQLDIVQNAYDEFKQVGLQTGINYIDEKTIHGIAQSKGPASASARKLIGAIGALTLELSKAETGAAPTDKAIAEAKTQMGPGWNQDTMEAILPMLRETLGNATESVNSVGVQGLGGKKSDYGHVGETKKETASANPRQAEIDEILNRPISDAMKKKLLIGKGLAR